MKRSIAALLLVSAFAGSTSFAQVRGNLGNLRLPIGVGNNYGARTQIQLTPQDLLAITSVTEVPIEYRDPSCAVLETRGVDLPEWCHPHAFEVRIKNNGAEIGSGNFLKVSVPDTCAGQPGNEVWIPFTTPFPSGGEMSFRLAHISGSIQVDAVNERGVALPDATPSNNIYQTGCLSIQGGGSQP